MGINMLCIGAGVGINSIMIQITFLLVCSVLTVWCHNCLIFKYVGQEIADCNNKKLVVIPNDLDRDIQVLRFHDNELTYLGMDAFENYIALQEIRLVRNRIELIAPDAFRGLYNLQQLDLEGNKLESLSPSIFQHLKSLRILSVKSNPIDIITKDALSKLKNIEQLDFENCWLQRIDAEAFKGLNQLKEINLINNELKTLDPHMEGYLPISLHIFRLYRNPWVCDCNIRWLRNYLDREEVEWDFHNNIPMCEFPELINGIVWRSLTPDQFVCAAQIITASNTSTSIELEVHGNVTINCVVQGDPQPDISWMRGTKYVATTLVSQRPCITDEGHRQICSSLTLNDLKLEDEGDYRCIAQNNAGRSEITYKLWVHDPAGGTTGETLVGLTSETLIGIGIGAGVLVLLIIACIIWMVRRQGFNRKRAYKARSYKKQARNGHDNHSPSKTDKTCYQVQEDKQQPVITEVKEIDKTAQVTVNCELPPIIPKPPETANGPKPVSENNVKSGKNYEFKMKIFKINGQEEGQTDLGKGNISSEVDNTDSTECTPLCNNKSGNKASKKPEQTVVDIIEPDVVQRADDSRANHRPPGSLTPPVANHVLHVGHKRAAENPYAKPSEMKSASTKSPATKRDTKKVEFDKTVICGTTGVDVLEKTPLKRKEGLHSPTGKGDAVTESKKVTTFSVEPSPCKNPVCLKDHDEGESSKSKSPSKQKQDFKKYDSMGSSKPHIKNSQSMGGIDKSADIDIGSKSPGNKSDRNTGSDRYRTLPTRPKAGSPVDDTYITTTYGSKPSRQLPSVSESALPPSKYVSLRQNTAPDVHPELSRPAAKTATISSPRQLPPMLRSPHNEPQIHGFLPGNPPDPIPAHLRSQTLNPRLTGRTSTGTHGDRSNSSPSRKLPQAYESTSLDDLLSPPFGHIQVDKPKSPKTQVTKLPKPGEKDEYGTAV